MSADKRTVSTDALETLGTIIGEGEKRDAIHLAVLPVRARALLAPGDSINCVGGVAKPDVNGIHAAIPAEFWVHAERVTGLTFTERPTHFSCSC